MVKNRFCLISGGALLLVFFFFSYLVQQQVFFHFDSAVTVYLQQNISRVFDVPFSFLSLIGSLEITGAVLVIFLIARKKIKSGIITLILFGVIHGFELYGKTFVKHPGPPASLLRYDLGFNFFSALVQPGSSYPSGHAARAFFITTIFFLLALRSMKLTKNKKLFFIICLACYDIAMCISRVYLAEHWTSDIIGGSLLGASLGLFSGIAL